MNRQVRGYSLFTAIAMIVGIVIGSGIFFKVDNILVYTDGNAGLAVIVLCIAAFSIIFGSLTMSQFASLTDQPGGPIAYADEFIGPRFACALGWFQTYIYFPALSVVLCWVVSIYIGNVFGWNLTLEGQIGIGLLWYSFCYGYNMLSARFGGIFQEVSMIVKLIPLFGVALSGIIFGDPAGVLAHPSAQAVEATRSLAWISAIGPVAFSFDGWIVATSISHEVKNSKKAMPKALVAASLFVLAAYLLYFLGLCGYLGADQVILYGDASVTILVSNLFGPFIASTVMVFIVISVMGSSNGIILGFIRIPYALGIRRMIPGSGYVSREEGGTVPMNSARYCFVIGLVWWFLHYVSQRYDLVPNSDVSEIAIVMNYMLYLFLYYQAFRLWKKGRIKGVRKGVIYPVLASLGSLFILIGGLQNPEFFYFVIICLVAILGGYLYGMRRH